jgi:hypothetical protein
MYNTRYLCRYHSPDVFLDTDEVNEKQKEYIRDFLYKEDILNIFDIDEYNEEVILAFIHKIYEKVKEHTGMKECMLKLANNMFSEDTELGLIILYAYDYLHLTHACVSEYIETRNISDDNIISLRNLVFE